MTGISGFKDKLSTLVTVHFPNQKIVAYKSISRAFFHKSNVHRHVFWVRDSNRQLQVLVI